MEKVDLWELVPQCAKDKYEEMKKEHKAACGNHETKESRKIRREMQLFYNFQIEAVKRKLQKAVLLNAD